MKRQHGRTGPRMVSAWTALWVGVLACFLVGLTVFLIADSNRPKFVTEQNVIGREVVDQVCPNRDPAKGAYVELYLRGSVEKRNNIDPDTDQFFKLCGFAVTGTPFVVP